MSSSTPNSNTIYLTPSESTRIRTTLLSTHKTRTSQTGKPRPHRDPKSAHQEVTGASLMADMGGVSSVDQNLASTSASEKAAGTVPVIAVGAPYPPCRDPLEKLETMKVRDLTFETRHPGRKIKVKRKGPVVGLVTRSWTMVKDVCEEEKEKKEEEVVERLEVCLHRGAVGGGDVLEEGHVFWIKEPWLTVTEQGAVTIRVDHPSDLVVVREEVEGGVVDVGTEVEVARGCKEKGNTALKKGDLPLAQAWYTKGLGIARQDAVVEVDADLARDISRNRALVNLRLNLLDAVKADAQGSIIGRQDPRSKDLDSKAFFRAGCAAYGIGEYQEAKNFFGSQIKLTPDDKDAAVYLRRIEIRIREQETGKYDWKKMRASLSRARPRVEAASFINNTEVKDSAGKGRGLFAVRDISAGEVVICEKAFCVVWGHESDGLTAMTYDIRDDKIRVSPVGLSKAVVQKLMEIPSQIGRVMDLYGDYQGENGDVFESSEGPIVDAFRVHDIVSRNAFGPGCQFGEEEQGKASTGLWIWAAYINHSCIANARKEYAGDMMVLRATRAISAGEEIFHSYDESSDYDTRQTALMTTWGFTCTCALCNAEKADDPKLRQRRQQLASEAETFMQREHQASAKRLTIAKAQRLAKAIDDTYDAARFKDLPHVASQRIHVWLSEAKKGR